MLSFIIPVFKPDYDIFKKCLKSLKSQSLTEWEAIVVFDGQDNAASLVCDGMQDKRFKQVVIDHTGVQRARNEGFKHSTGEIVSFWDCDCIIEPDAAKMWVDRFKDNSDTAFIYSGYKFLNEQGGIPSEAFDPWTLKCGNYISTMFPMRRVVFPGFDESLESLQDWDMWLTIVERGGKGLFVPGYAFSTALPTPDSISGKGCADGAWLGRVKAVKDKHNLPDRKICVSSLGLRHEGIRLAKLINADYKDVPNFKPNNYETIIQVGFSLHPQHVKSYASIFNQPLRKKIIFWAAGNISEINDSVSHRALREYSNLLNAQTIQFVEDMAAKKIMESAGFNVSVMPIPMLNTDALTPLPEKIKILIDSTNDFRQIITCLQHSLPDVEFDGIDSNKPVSEYNALLTLTPDRTMSDNVKRMLLSGRNVIGNIQSPYCGFVNETQDIGAYISEMVDTIRKRARKDTSAAVAYWGEVLSTDKLMEVLK